MDVSAALSGPMADTLARAAFGVYVLAILGGGLAAVLAGSLVRALVGLIVTMFGVAGMYLLLAAPFVALMQLLIYVGAVAVLVFFAIMLVRSPADSGGPGDPGEEGRPNPLRKHLAALAAGASPLVLTWTLFRHPVAAHAVPQETPLAILGKKLLEDYVLAFELISVVLFVAMAAAVMLTFNRRTPGRGQS